MAVDGVGAPCGQVGFGQIRRDDERLACDDWGKRSSGVQIEIEEEEEDGDERG